MQKIRVMLIFSLFLLNIGSLQAQQASMSKKVVPLLAVLLAIKVTFSYWAGRSPKMSRLLLRNLKQGNMDKTRALVWLGAKINHNDINVADPDDTMGRTPLHYAAWYGHDAIVRDLIKRNADVNANTMPPYGAALYSYPPLHAAAARGHDTVVRSLIEGGADVNATTSWKNTPLHAAAARGHDTVVRYLIKRGADVNATSTGGLTPLNYALSPNDVVMHHTENEDVIETLLKHGAIVGDRAALDKSQQNRLDRIFNRIQKEVAQSVSDAQQSIPGDIAGEISRFTY